MKKEISEKIEVKDTFFSYDRQIICGKDINSGDKKARAERRWDDARGGGPSFASDTECGGWVAKRCR